MRVNVRGRIVVGLMLAGLLLAGCGSSKPSYCSAVNSLKASIKALPSTDVIANGTNALKSAVSKATNASELIESMDGGVHISVNEMYTPLPAAGERRTMPRGPLRC